MRNKILSIKQAIKVSKELKNQNKIIVLAGGIFDILHPGHIKFLENAKREGDYLFVLLEDDNRARVKGPKRPINTQKNRAIILSAIRSVDYIVLLKNMTNNYQYDRIVLQLAPNILATTNPDPYIDHKKRQAKLIKGKVVSVISRIGNYSTTQLIKSQDKLTKSSV
ncbi:MAG: adenylyltransferase/cytidyltransferase family protein [Candidatus Levybacteria bacterium]|nr:adenylyltransferase/cytidyltransferase family protein [Candidatus Levybacteria bacterium]